MPNREKVIAELEDIQKSFDEGYGVGLTWESNLIRDTLKLLKEQEKLINVDDLREKLGIAENCEKCEQDSRHCQYDSHFSLMDFCERFDIAIEELMMKGQ